GSWTREPSTAVDTWSEELYHIFGVSPGNFTPTHESICQLVHPDDRAQYCRDTAPAGIVRSVERDLRIVRPDGKVRSLHHSIVVEPTRNGEPSRVHGTVQDVTEAREAERQLREQVNLLNLSRDAIIVREADDTIRFWNHGAQRIYGWSAEEVLGRRASDFSYVDRSKFLRAKELLAERGEWTGELEHFCKDGSIVNMGSRWSAVPNEQTGTSSVLVINTDLSEQKKLEQQLLRTQRLESIGTLASGVAHDLNNILAPIMMAAPLLRDELPLERRRKLVGVLEHNAERGAAIVRQVLTFAQGADGERILVQPIYPLNEIARIARETFPKSITTRTDFPDDLALVEADPTELHHVVLNLCVNARDAMPDGGTLSLSAENFQVDEHYAAMTPGLTSGPHVLIKVTDTGTGIPPEIMDKIFDPFFTTKALGNGTGLGLSTVLGVVRNYGGSVNAESTGRGTTLRILLPAAGADFGPTVSPADEELPRGRGETILVVDDEDAIRAVAEPLLRKHGYEVLLAADAPAALSIFAEHSARIALTLTDFSMPVMSGLALARTLRKMQADASIIISAGREDTCNAGEMDAIGVAATLPKPYTQAALLRLLDQVISAKRKTL
ncbi:MAG TPA: PAS domain S-box protein, partial [Chthoniobacterales bacterium]|nr:PAS domain S-box protein [Chthoniobacterales bacterium]